MTYNIVSRDWSEVYFNVFCLGNINFISWVPHIPLQINRSLHVFDVMFYLVRFSRQTSIREIQSLDYCFCHYNQFSYQLQSLDGSSDLFLVVVNLKKDWFCSVMIYFQKWAQTLGGTRSFQKIMHYVTEPMGTEALQISLTKMLITWWKYVSSEQGGGWSTF